MDNCCIAAGVSYPLTRFAQVLRKAKAFLLSESRLHTHTQFFVCVFFMYFFFIFLTALKIC